MIRAALAAVCVAFALPAVAGAHSTGCSLHAQTKDVRVVMCVTHLDPTHCRLLFRVSYIKLGIGDHFGRKVPCPRLRTTAHAKASPSTSPPQVMAFVLTTVWNSEQLRYRFTQMTCRRAGRAYGEAAFACRSRKTDRTTGAASGYDFVVLADGTVISSHTRIVTPAHVRKPRTTR